MVYMLILQVLMCGLGAAEAAAHGATIASLLLQLDQSVPYDRYENVPLNSPPIQFDDTVINAAFRTYTSQHPEVATLLLTLNPPGAPHKARFTFGDLLNIPYFAKFLGDELRSGHATFDPTSKESKLIATINRPQIQPPKRPMQRRLTQTLSKSSSLPPGVLEQIHKEVSSGKSNSHQVVQQNGETVVYLDPSVLRKYLQQGEQTILSFQPTQQSSRVPTKTRPTPPTTQAPILTTPLKGKIQWQGTVQQNTFIGLDEATVAPPTTTTSPQRGNSKVKKARSRPGIQQPEFEELEGLQKEEERVRSSLYSFESKFEDPEAKLSNERVEVKDGNVVRGAYSYSDGFFKRTVHYEADENGFRIVKEEVIKLEART